MALTPRPWSDVEMGEGEGEGGGLKNDRLLDRSGIAVKPKGYPGTDYLGYSTFWYPRFPIGTESTLIRSDPRKSRRLVLGSPLAICHPHFDC